jgi:hypothetical protein
MSSEAITDTESDAAEASVFAQLDELAIPYERMSCDPSLADTEQFCAHYGVAREASGNTIIVASRKEPRQYPACLVTAISVSM